MKSRWRYWLLLAIAAAAIVSLALYEPIPQESGYHALADSRTLLAVPNFWNVVSNVPFLIVGMTGLLTLRRKNSSGDLQLLAPSYRSFFIGLILVSFGSAFYHLNPNNSTLVWDRLPMTMVFMAFFAIVIGQHLDLQLGRRCLPYLIVLGLASVIYWHVSELRGEGDLRAYALVQFLPLALIPIITILFPPAFSRSSFIWGLLGLYGVAKIVELLDEPIYRALGISGHTLKHLCAAAGAALLLAAVRELDFTEGNGAPA